MSIWIAAAIIAALAQTVRFVLQKHLSVTGLSVNGATFARFVYSLPIVVGLVVLFVVVNGVAIPQLNLRFFIFAGIGAIFQMLATICVVATFKYRNFSIGVTFKKTEVMQAAIVGLILLGDAISAVGWIALSIGLIGVLVLSDPPKATGPWRARIWDKAAGLGLLSGLMFALCGVAFRAGLLELETDAVLFRSMFALAYVLCVQVLVMGTWLMLRETGEISRVLSAWRVASFVGIAGMVGSLGWFTAFSLQTVAYVNAVGQVELIFTLFASILIFKEKAYVREFLGVAILLASILILILYA